MTKAVLSISGRIGWWICSYWRFKIIQKLWSHWLSLRLWFLRVRFIHRNMPFFLVCIYKMQSMNKTIKIIPHLPSLLIFGSEQNFDLFFKQLWITSMSVLLVQRPPDKPRNEQNQAVHISWLHFLLLYKHILKFMHLKTSAPYFLVFGCLVGKCQCLQLFSIWPNHVQQKSLFILPVLT